MRASVIVLFFAIFVTTELHAADDRIPAATETVTAGSRWYTGDERCTPPLDDGRYSAPYRAQDNPRDYPTFAGADRPGWFCSYQRNDGVMVQYGDSRTPQQQWMDMYAGADN